MPHTGERQIAEKALIVDDEINLPTANGRAFRALVEELQNRDVIVVESVSSADGESLILFDPSSSESCSIEAWETTTQTRTPRPKRCFQQYDHETYMSPSS